MLLKQKRLLLLTLIVLQTHGRRTYGSVYSGTANHKFCQGKRGKCEVREEKGDTPLNPETPLPLDTTVLTPRQHQPALMLHSRKYAGRNYRLLLNSTIHLQSNLPGGPGMYRIEYFDTKLKSKRTKLKINRVNSITI